MRDRGALESALARPAATFGGEDLYPDIADKAAALIHSLALNHPFVDGNKRVAAFAAIVFVESAAPARQAATALLQHMWTVQPDYPSRRHRDEDLADHLSLRQRLDRAAHAFTSR